MPEQLSRRRLFANAWGAIVAVVASRVAYAQTKESLMVYKDPQCGCCEKWVDHMRASGFVATVISGDMKPIKARYKIPANLESCHTTIVRNYIIEGHVPAEDVRKLLAAKPTTIVGLTIPGMPASAPGMDVLPFRPYDVLSFDQKGATKLFARHDKA